MNTITLDEHYRVESDSTSWNLVYEKIGPELNDKGLPKVSRRTSYHAKLQHALSTYVDQALKPSSEVSDVLNRLRATEQRIEAARILDL